MKKSKLPSIKALNKLRPTVDLKTPKGIFLAEVANPEYYQTAAILEIKSGNVDQAMQLLMLAKYWEQVDVPGQAPPVR